MVQAIDTAQLLGLKESSTKVEKLYILRSKNSGKKVKLNSGKSSWRTSQAVSAAITHHLKASTISLSNPERFDLCLASGRIIHTARMPEKIDGFYFLGEYGQVIRKQTLKEVKQYVLENMLKIEEIL